MKKVLKDMNTPYSLKYVQELEDTEERHFNKPLSNETRTAGRMWANLRELIETASFAHPLYRQGLWIPQTRRAERRHRFQKHCLTMCMKAHKVADAGCLVPPSASPAQAAMGQSSQQAAKPERGADKLFAAINAMNNLDGAPTVSKSDAADSVAEPVGPQRTLREEIVHVCDTHMAAEPTHEHYTSYYSNKKVRPIFRYIAPGLQSLLRFQASNGLGERIFGKLGRLLTKNSKNLDCESKLCLNVNAQYFQLEGYRHMRSYVPEDADYEVFAGFVA